MAARPVSDKNIKEIERLRGLGFSGRKIARSLGLHRATVKKYLEEKARAASVEPPEWVRELDWVALAAEYAKGVSVQVLWEEQHEAGKVPVQYAGFWKQLCRHVPSKAVTMRRVFAPGERAEVDYCDGIDIYDPVTGEVRSTQLFVGVLCHSRYAFAEFTWSQKSEDFLLSHRHMFEYFGGVPQVISPDNLKSAVTKSHRYDPDINQAYTRLAQHYGCAVVPARVRRPKDKAIAERTVQIFQRWFYARVRNRTFTSLTELNQCLKDHLELFHQKQHRIFRASRQQMFEAEREKLLPLPETPYEVQAHYRATVHPDCHISFDKNFYSAPHYLRGKRVDIWASNKMVEIYHLGERVALHGRTHRHGHYHTNKLHYPEGHQAYWDSTVKAIRTQASRLGPATSKLIHQLLSGPYPLQYLRRCQGIVRLSKHHDKEHLNRACQYALDCEKLTYVFVERLLKNPAFLVESQDPKPHRQANPYLRGNDYFTKGEDDA